MSLEIIQKQRPSEYLKTLEEIEKKHRPIHTLQSRVATLQSRFDTVYAKTFVPRLYAYLEKW